MSERAEFNLKNLSRLDGARINAAFDKLFKQAVADCMDRPGEEKARKVVLEVEVKPSLDQMASGDRVAVAFNLKATVPPYLSEPYQMTPHRGGSASFHPDLPEDAPLFHKNEPPQK